MCGRDSGLKSLFSFWCSGNFPPSLTLNFCFAIFKGGYEFIKIEKG